MKTRFFKLFAITLIISLASCKNEKANVFTDYKFSDKPETLACEGMDTKLLKEALYTFEDDIIKHYNSKNSNLSQSYSRFINEALSNRLKPENLISAHTVKVFEALKNNNALWNQSGASSKLNYNSKTIKCIANNIKDQRIKSTFNALLSTHSLNPQLFGATLQSNARILLNDRSLATYVALDFYYSKLFDRGFHLLTRLCFLRQSLLFERLVHDSLQLVADLKFVGYRVTCPLIRTQR